LPTNSKKEAFSFKFMNKLTPIETKLLVRSILNESSHKSRINQNFINTIRRLINESELRTEPLTLDEIGPKMRNSTQVQTISELIPDRNNLRNSKIYAARLSNRLYLFNEDAWHMPLDFDKNNLPDDLPDDFFPAYIFRSKSWPAEKREAFFQGFGLHRDGQWRLWDAPFQKIYDAGIARIKELDDARRELAFKKLPVREKPSSGKTTRDLNDPTKNSADSAKEPSKKTTVNLRGPKKKI